VEILNLDLLTYAGDLANLEGADGDPRHTFVRGDVCDGPLVRRLMEGVGAVLNLAAESHVDRSIRRPAPFVRTDFGGGSERTNLGVVREVLRVMGAPEELITFVPDRPGHDRRYALDCAKARKELGWTPHRSFEVELPRTLEWYRNRLPPVDMRGSKPPLPA
jgi:dTDP-D-glucose 4,6-dehydratase